MSEYCYILFTYVTFCIKCLPPFLICNLKVGISTYSNVLYFCLTHSPQTTHTHTHTPLRLSIPIYTHYFFAKTLSNYIISGLKKKKRKIKREENQQHARFQDKIRTGTKNWSAGHFHPALCKCSIENQYLIASQ